MAIVELRQIKRRRYGVEEEWFDVLTRLGHGRLRHEFIEAGISPQVAGNLVWFIEDQVTLERALSKATRNRYRGALAELDPSKILAASARRAIPGQFNSRRVA